MGGRGGIKTEWRRFKREKTLQKYFNHCSLFFEGVTGGCNVPAWNYKVCLSGLLVQVQFFLLVFAFFSSRVN